MKETLGLLMDYANQSDNLWLSRKMQILEGQIEIEIINAEIGILNKLTK